MILAFIVIGFVGLTIFGMTRAAGTYPAPWCEKENGQFRCHLPRGHAGGHRCDDFSGDFSWGSDD